MGSLVQVVNPMTSQSIFTYLRFIGEKPCLWCLITLEELAIPLTIRGPCIRRTLASIVADHNRFLLSGGNLKNAKNFNNCIDEPFFNIELSQVDVNNDMISYRCSDMHLRIMQVCLPGLHITLGVFKGFAVPSGG